LPSYKKRLVSDWILKINRPPLVLGFKHNLDKNELESIHYLKNRQEWLLTDTVNQYEAAVKSGNETAILLAKRKVMGQIAVYECNMGLILEYLKKIRS
jgi:hypothetical protein